MKRKDRSDQLDFARRTAARGSYFLAALYLCCMGWSIEATVWHLLGKEARQ